VCSFKELLQKSYAPKQSIINDAVVKKPALRHETVAVVLLLLTSFVCSSRANPIVPPYIDIQSPQNKIYSSSEIELNFVAPSMELPENTQFTSFSYSLDGSSQVAIEGNTTIAGLPWGSHNIIVYAQDNEGLTYFSQTVHFDVVISTVWVLAALIVAAIVGLGLLAYFKKRHRTRIYGENNS